MSDTYTQGKTDLAGKAKEVFRDAKAKAAGLTDDVSRLAKDNAAQLGDAARDFAGNAKEKIETAAGQRKSLGADYVGSLAQATGQAAQAFENDLPQAARYIRQASAQIQGVADTIRERDVRERVSDVQDFARQQPTRGCGDPWLCRALRFLKSTSPKHSPTFDAAPENSHDTIG